MKSYRSVEEFVHDLTVLSEQHRDKLAAGDGLYCVQLEDGRTWYLLIDGGRVTVTDAADAEPCCTVSSDEATILDLLAGRLHPMKAILHRRVRAKGDVLRLVKLAGLV